MSDVPSLTDFQAGPICRINGNNAYSFYKADLSDMPEHVSWQSTKEFRYKIGRTGFLIDKSDISNGGIKLVFHVSGRTKKEAVSNCNKLVAELNRGQKTIVIIDPDSNEEFNYICILNNYAIEDTGIKYYFKVSVEMYAIRVLPMETIILSGSNPQSGVPTIIDNSESLETGARILIDLNASAIQSMPVNDIATLTIRVTDDLIASNNSNIAYDKTYSILITAANSLQYPYLVIDGINGKVVHAGSKNEYERGQGVSALNMVNLSSFPLVCGSKGRWVYVSLDYPGILNEIKMQYEPCVIM